MLGQIPRPTREIAGRNNGEWLSLSLALGEGVQSRVAFSLTMCLSPSAHFHFPTALFPRFRLLSFPSSRLRSEPVRANGC
jgi:hypothetical protein